MKKRRDRAHVLFQSLGRLQRLSPELLVLPGHASEPISFDGVPLAASLEEVFSRLQHRLLSEDAFVFPNLGPPATRATQLPASRRTQ